jgi:organic hydroperoxide reductase OsmC/OhrA
MSEREHGYAARLVWDGNTGEGTASYTSYGRQYHVAIEGKPELAGSADAAFRGEAAKHNPEDLFLTSIAACHMLFYLSQCARRGIRVLAYEDEVRGTMTVDADGGGRFEEVRLNPVVTIADAAQAPLAEQLHEAAHELCFIANSCSVPIRHRATVRAA